MTVVDISSHIDELCQRFGVPDKTFVREIVLRPTTIEFDCYVPREGDGAKHIYLKNGEAVTRRLTFEVSR